MSEIFINPPPQHKWGMRGKDEPMKLCCMMRHQKAASSEMNQILIFLLKCSHLTVTFWPDQCGLKLK